MRWQATVCVSAAAVVLTACGGDHQQDAYVVTGPLARVLVDATGAVHLNGQPVAANTLADSLRALQAAGGGVVYTRTPKSAELNAAQKPAVRTVLTTVTDLGLPLRLVSPDSFSLPDSLLRR